MVRSLQDLHVSLYRAHSFGHSNVDLLIAAYTIDTRVHYHDVPGHFTACSDKQSDKYQVQMVPMLVTAPTSHTTLYIQALDDR